MRSALLSLLATGAMVAAAGAQTPIVIDDFEDTDYTASAGAGETLSVANVPGEEGSTALEVTYEYTAQDAWFKNANIRKDFDVPLDLSGVEYFTLEANVPEAESAFMMVVHLWDDQGYTARLLSYGAFTAATDGWDTYTFRTSNLQKTRWAAFGRAPNLASISGVSFHIQNQAGVPAGTYSFELDNFVGYADADLLNEEVVLDFEAYTSSTEVEADWTSSFSGADASLSNDAFSGDNSLAVTTVPTGQYYTHSVRYELPEALDISDALYFKMAVRGETSMEGLNNAVVMHLEDSAGRRVIGWVWLWPMQDEWSLMLLPFQADGIEGYTSDSNSALAFGGNSAWRYDYWDGSDWDDNADLTDIVAIRLGFGGQGPGDYPTEPVTILFDDIVMGFQSDLPATDPGEEVPSEKSYVVQPLQSVGQVTVDGAVSSGEWDNASAPATGFVLHNDPNTAATEDPEIRALWDENYLYLLYQVVNADFSLDFTPTGDGRDPSGTGFGGDDFEFFIAPGGPMAAEYYQIVFFPYEGDGVTYVWDAYMAAGPDSWDADGDKAEFTYNSGTNLLTIEYRIPWTAFDNANALVEGPPAEGEQWGVQIGYINNNPSEAVNWEPSTAAGFANGRPFGTFVFTGEAPGPTSAESWHLYQ